MSTVTKVHTAAKAHSFMHRSNANFIVYIDERILNAIAKTCIDKHVPLDVINLCIRYYDLEEKFKHYNIQDYSIKDYDLTAFKSKYDRSCVYGQICIPSCSRSKHKWVFKIHSCYYRVGFGIDETKYIRKYWGDFNHKHGQSKLYGVWNNGAKVQWDITNTIKDSELRFKEGDTVEMELDLLNEIKTLSYTVNFGGKVSVFWPVHVDVDTVYSMISCCYYHGDKIQLVSYTSSCS